jgi:hypothetical protein
MRKNEYDNIEQIKSQYIGVWGPSDGHWFGLDFMYNGQEYRIHTGTMYGTEDNVVNGVVKQFGLYKKTDEPDEKYPTINKYLLMFEYESFDDLLKNAIIDSLPLEIVIMDDETEMLGQD